MSIEFLEQSVKLGKSENDTVESFVKELEAYVGLACEMQRGSNWYIGDLCNAAESVWRRHKLPGDWTQVVPVWASPGLIDRCRAVSAAYKKEERNINATWSIHMNHKNDPDRIALVQAAVDAGQTSDENRKHPAMPVTEETPAESQECEPDGELEATEPPEEPQTPVPADEPPKKVKWLLAVDVSYYVCSTFFSGAGIEAASTVDGWLARLIKRLSLPPEQGGKGLTDIVCCIDSPNSFRKDLTKDWEHPYKLRVQKEDELRVQLNLAVELLKKRNLPCVSIDGMEADDIMASYATQFDGRISLLTKDKDMRQCLSEKCNMLTEVTWEENAETGKQVPKYKWVTAASHMRDGCPYQSSQVSGITPEAWPHFQALAGDTGDNVKGAIGIGPKVAVDLIKEHGTVQGVIAACKDNKADLTDKKRLAILDFEPLAETTLKLVTMVDNLPVPMITTICMKEPS